MYITKISIILLIAIIAVIASNNNILVSSLECETYPSQKIKNIPSEYINDNYCDCPYTGEDEPNTSACSGSIGWSSTSSDEENESNNYFQCEGQNLVLPASKVNDGICDCCSGNDESKEGLCADICEEVLAEERRLQRELKEAFDIGYVKNIQSKKEYKEFVDSTKNEMEDIQLKINDINVDIVEKTKDFKEEIRQWRGGRRRILEEVVVSNDYSWILSLTPHEAKSLLLGLCQISGEWWYTLPKVTNVDNEEKTCIPLHLAALELGFMFNTETTTEFIPWKQPSNDDNNTDNNLNLPKLLLELELGYTSSNEKATTSNVPDYDDDKDDYEHDDIDDADYEEYYDDEHEYDEDIVDRRERKQREQQQQNSDIDDINQSTSNIEEQDQQLVLPRAEFEMEAKKILTMIQAIFDTPDADGGDNDDTDIPHDENEQETSETEPPAEIQNLRDEYEDQQRMLHEADNDAMPSNVEEQLLQEKSANKQKVIIQNMPDNIDTIQLQKVQKDIKTYLKHISIGKNYLKSANTMIDSLFVEDENGDIIKSEYLQNDNYIFPCLLLGTLYHSRILSIDLYTILYHIIPEIKSQHKQQSSFICDVTSNSLPSIERNLKSGADGNVFSVSIPSNKILLSSNKYCEERMEIISSSCNNEQQSIVVDDFIIPYNVHNGCINNYFPTTYYEKDNEEGTTNNNDSILPSLFEIINSKVTTSKQTNIDILRQEMSSLKNEMEQKGKNLNSDKYGTSNGELYAFRDEQCFEKQANQYTYEVCMLGNSYQKEGSSKTSLGKFHSFKVEENIVDNKTETSMAALFQNGQRCWQGQNRKAKVNIICGSSLGELISAEEPEVCSYEFILKSYIACTDSYARENGLVVNEECVMHDGNKECSSFA